MGIDKIIEERHATRLKHLEDPNYRRWSDLVDTKSYNYGVTVLHPKALTMMSICGII